MIDWLFSLLNEVRFRSIARTFAEAGDVPTWFVDLEYINWSGTDKDLSFIPHGTIDQTILIDDRIEYIHPDQKYRWLEISGYEYPYPDDDRERLQILIEVGSLHTNI